MRDLFITLFRRFAAYILSFLALLNLHPNTPAPNDGQPRQTAYTFATEEEYRDYYLYCTDPDPEPYSWSPEALAARDNVEKVCSVDGFSVTVFKNKTARINALEQPKRDVSIPAEVEGCPVTAIYSILPYNDYDNAAKIVDAVRTVTIPDSVEYIMERAFEDLANLRSVTFGAGVKYMEANAFRSCGYLTRIVLPEPLEAVPPVAFEGCTALTEVVFGSNIRSVGRYAFENCPCLRSITLPASVTLLETHCFAMCKNLTYAYVPASVASIEDLAFGKCDRLTLHGEAGSAAQRYAEENGIPFRTGK